MPSLQVRCAGFTAPLNIDPSFDIVKIVEVCTVVSVPGVPADVFPKALTGLKTVLVDVVSSLTHLEDVE